MSVYIIATLKVLYATVVGALIGYERERKGKPAGIKTHSLVCLSACIVTLVGIMTFKDTNIGDPMRLPAQVISGIGFIGAGVIMNKNNVIFGLTSAAGLWLAGCMGVVIGSDYTFISIPAIIAYILISRVFPIIEDKMKREQ